MIEVLWFGAVGVAAAAAGWVLWERKYRQRLRGLAARRDDLTAAAFVSILSDSADPDVAAWVRAELLAYWQPGAAPHPDDDFVKDLPIDPEEPNDWLSRFCSCEGIDAATFPAWPYGEATTVRNLAAWFTDGRNARLAARSGQAAGPGR